MVQRIVILGAPGAGKGTQARRLHKAHGWPHISTGDIFRKLVEDGSELGKKIEHYLNNGQLLPDSLACEIVARRLLEPDCADGYILDGFPRSVPQAEELDKLLRDRGEALTVVFNLEVSDDEIVDRLTQRRTCPECGRIYNLKYKPPKSGEVCDKDGTALVQRSDDVEETVRERLRVYHEKTEPIIIFYKNKSVLKSVGATHMSPDEVTGQIENALHAVNEA